MKIAYVTAYDARDVKQWSGLGFNIAKALETQGVELSYVGPLKIKNLLIQKLKRRYYKSRNKIYRIDRNSSVIKYFGKQIVERLPDDVDLIFCPASIPVALLETDKPIVFYTDAAFRSMKSFYPEFKKYAKESIRDADRMEAEAIRRADLIIYSSDWAANSAINDYGAPPDKVKVVPFGANLESDLSEKEVDKIIESRSREICKLLFLGVYWERKGGDTALEVAAELNRAGIKTELNLVGISPDFQLPDFVKSHGFISKSTKEGLGRINKLIADAHFLILPSIADCTPVVFSEANSFGVPCISTNVGGISSVLKDGLNGFTFDLGQKASVYAEKIKDVFGDYEAYKLFAKTSYLEYRNRLNWSTSAGKIKSYLENLINK